MADHPDPERRSVTVWECKCSTGWTDFGLCPECQRRAKEIRYVPATALAAVEIQRDAWKEAARANAEDCKAAETRLEAVREWAEEAANAEVNPAMPNALYAGFSVAGTNAAAKHVLALLGSAGGGPDTGS